MYSLAKAIDDLDPSLFSFIESQTSDSDRRALLALHSSVAARYGSFTYLEIGSYLGGSLQVVLRDPRCERAFSVDTRPSRPPDKQSGSCDYGDNTTAHMLELLDQVPDAETGKLVTFDAATESLSRSQVNGSPKLCFVDGEHTDEAALCDARFCLQVIDGAGVIAFHDCRVIRPAIQSFVRENWRDVSLAVAFESHRARGGGVFAVEFGSDRILSATTVERALNSRWQKTAWRVVSQQRISVVPLFGLWSTIPLVERLRDVSRIRTRLGLR